MSWPGVWQKVATAEAIPKIAMPVTRPFRRPCRSERPPAVSSRRARQQRCEN
jgi:hypothetical protein